MNQKGIIGQLKQENSRLKLNTRAKNNYKWKLTNLKKKMKLYKMKLD